MPVNTEVLVVGGGVVGAACARELAWAGMEVTCIDPGGVQGQGWRAAAGLLAPQVEGGADDPLLEIGLAGREWHATAGKSLEAATGIDLKLKFCGILSLAFARSDEERLEAKAAWQGRHGLSCEWILPDQLKQRWPWLPSARGALHAPRDGALDPAQLVEALVRDGQRAGVRRIEDRISELESDGQRVSGVRGREQYSAPTVVLAAGAWSGRIGKLPRPLSVEPVRGQMLALPRPAQLEEEAIVYGRGHYLLTRDHELIAGSTMEHAAFDFQTTPEGIAGIREGVERLCPFVKGVAPLRSWAGLRPGTPDGLPIIGPEPRLAGLWYATGHGRNGVLLAGITGVVLLQMMRREATLESMARFRPERFWNW